MLYRMYLHRSIGIAVDHHTTRKENRKYYAIYIQVGYLTPAYIEQFFMSRQTPIENQWEATWIH